MSWGDFISHYAHQMLARDFFAVETIALQTVYVFFFIDIGTRWVHYTGCTAHPNAPWVAQQARQLMWDLQEREQRLRFLIHDNDSKFAGVFDDIFVSEGLKVIKTPFRAPRANAYAERWIRSVRQECLDQILVINQSHLHRVMREYTRFYNEARPHQGIGQRIPAGQPSRPGKGSLTCWKVLGGLVHDYYRRAA